MSFSLYLLQVNLYLIVFYCFYKLLLSKETYFKLNRFYLMASGGFSLLIPLIKIDWLSYQVASKQVHAAVNWSSVVAQASAIVEEPKDVLWTKWVVYFYLAGVAFFVLKLTYNLIVANKHVSSSKEGVAYSFFLKKNVDDQLPLSDIINEHEEAHIKQWHSVDILFLELVSAFNWFNPVLYAYRKEIKNVHEFLADEAAANYHGDKSEYALLLLSKAMGVAPNNLLSGFLNKSVLKERIFMLHKNRSKKLSILKYGIFLPLFACSVIISSAFIRENKQLKAAALKMPIKLPVKEAIEMANNFIADSSVAQLPNTMVKNSKIQIRQNTAEPVEVLLQVAKDSVIADNRLYDFVSIEKAPNFPGGINEFYNYVAQNLKYPEIALENNVQGKVFLSFIVEKDGSLQDVKVTRGLGSGTDEEAMRVVSKSPKWEPGLVNGDVVRVRYNININFKANLEEPKKVEESSKKAQIKLIGTPTNANRAFYAKQSVSSPLLIIDNVEQNSTVNISSLDPNKIAVVSVFKSEKATALYGTKAINGVVLITTKGFLAVDKKTAVD